jgi:hypothetical protein
MVSWVTLLLIVLVGGAAYLGWIWVPLYFDHYTVKQVVRDYMNQAVKNPNDAALRAGMVRKIAALVEVSTVDENGRSVRVPAISIDEQNVSWERTEGPPRMLHVSFEYEREAVYPFLERTETKVFSVDLSNDLTPPDWGPAR